MAKKSAPSEHWPTLAGVSEYQLAVFARAISVSARHLRRLSQAHFQQSPQQWLRQERMRAARTFLLGGLSVKEAAGRVGCKQVSHFSRLYKLYYGLSPRAFVKTHYQSPSGRGTAQPITDIREQ